MRDICVICVISGICGSDNLSPLDRKLISENRLLHSSNDALHIGDPLHTGHRADFVRLGIDEEKGRYKAHADIGPGRLGIAQDTVPCLLAIHTGTECIDVEMKRGCDAVERIT